MESRHSSEILLQLSTVAPFQGLAKLLDCLAGDLLCLLDFHVCPPVSGSYCSLHSQPREQSRNGGQKRRGGCVQVGTSGTPNDTGFGGARRASEDRRRDELRAGTRTTRSGQLGEQ